MVLVRMMEVVCGSERLAAAGTQCPRELGTLGYEGHKKEGKPGHCARRGKEMQKRRVANSVEVLHSSGWVCHCRQDGVLVLFIVYIWLSIILSFG